MDRKEFIKTCGFACLGATSVGVFLQSCSAGKMITGDLSGDVMTMPLSAFEEGSGGTKSYRKYIVVNHPEIKYPIGVYRASDKEYTALYMQCTHKGTKLKAKDDKLVCPAHGSEFDTKGNVTDKPASKPLKSFPVTIADNNLSISLKSL